MPRLSELADILVKCRVISRTQWDEAAQGGRDDLSQILDCLTKNTPSWWEGQAPAPPGLTEYQRDIIQARFDDDELKVLRRDLALNQFVLLDKLGHGGQGEVYRARQLNPPRFAAVKILIRDNESRRKRFEQEARAMIRIQHPAVARFYLYERIRGAGGEPTDEYLIAMEFVNGTDLQQLVRKIGPIPWPFAVHWICDLLSGLQVIHRSGFIHRDVKPENVMIVGPQPVPGVSSGATAAKLLDFGAVNRVDEPIELGKSATSRVFVGTMEYAAPEQWAGRIVVASDIYALGGTLFYMLTGRHAFKKEKRDPVSYMHSHLHEEVPDIVEFNQNVPPRLNRLFRQMMSKDPSERGTSTDLLKEFQGLRPSEDFITPAPAGQQRFEPPRSKSTTVEPEKPTDVVPLRKPIALVRETGDQNPVVRATDRFLALFERIFMPKHMRGLSAPDISVVERLLALLRQPVVLVLLVLLLIAVLILR